jgi:hypothetical protein
MTQSTTNLEIPSTQQQLQSGDSREKLAPDISQQVNQHFNELLSQAPPLRLPQPDPDARTFSIDLLRDVEELSQRDPS